MLVRKFKLEIKNIQIPSYQSLKKKGLVPKLGLFILLILFFASILRGLQAGLAYDETLDTSNHAYPVYLVLTMELNNKTSEGLVASTTIFNETAKKWTTNYVMINQIQNDLNKLPAVIDGLEQATLFDYNITYRPGCVYILLSPESLSLAGKVTNQTIDYVLSHPFTWWYVANLTFETFDLSMFDAPLDRINIFSIAVATLPVRGAFQESNGTFIPNPEAYTIVNDTIIPKRLVREGIEASLLVYNGTDWVLNAPFVEYLNDCLQLISNQSLFKNNSVMLFSNRTDYGFLNGIIINGVVYQNYNVTPILNENTTDADIVATIFIGTSFDIDISYSTLFSHYYQRNHHDTLFSKEWNKLLQLYLTAYVIISHLWFCTSINYAGFFKNANSVNLMIISLAIPLIMLTAIVISVRNKKRP